MVVTTFILLIKKIEFELNKQNYFCKIYEIHYVY